MPSTFSFSFKWADSSSFSFRVVFVQPNRREAFRYQARSAKVRSASRISTLRVHPVCIASFSRSGWSPYPYVWGGSNPNTSFDCSGYVSWVINHSGWNVGRLGAQGLCNICTPVTGAQARPGDLIFFKGTYDTPGVSHVGIYVGNGMMIHCGNPISYANVNTTYWKNHFYAYDNKLFIAKPDGSPQRRDRMSANFGQLIRHLEMPHIRFHDLRHTAATNMHQLTGDFYTVGEILGHTLKGIGISLGISTNLEAVTAQYVDVRLERKQSVLQTYHKALQPKTTVTGKEAGQETSKKAKKKSSEMEL